MSRTWIAIVVALVATCSVPTTDSSSCVIEGLDGSAIRIRGRAGDQRRELVVPARDITGFTGNV